METKNSVSILVLLPLILYLPACAQNNPYYGSNKDSIQQNVIDIRSIDIQGVKILDKIDKAIAALGKPDSKSVDIDEVNGERYTTLYYGNSNKSFLDFHHSPELGVVLIDFSLSNSQYEVTIDKKKYRVGDNVNLIKSTFSKSYSDYVNNEDPYKSLRIIVFKDGKRMGLEILFVLRENKIYSISTRYDE